MEEDDDDEWLDSSNDDVPKGASAWTRAAAKRARVECERKTSKRHGKSQRRLPNDLAELCRAEKDIRTANIGQQLSDDVSRRVLLTTVIMQLDYVERTQKEGANSSRKIAPPRVRERVCRLLGVGPTAYSKIVHSYFDAKRTKSASSPSFYTAARGKGNINSKTTRVPNTTKGCVTTRDFVRSKRARHDPPSHGVSGSKQVACGGDRGEREL